MHLSSDQGGQASELHKSIRRLASATGGNVDDFAGTTIGAGIVPDGILLTGPSSTITEEVKATGGHGAGTAPNAYHPTGTVECICRGASVAAGGDGMYSA